MQLSFFCVQDFIFENLNSLNKDLVLFSEEEPKLQATVIYGGGRPLGSGGQLFSSPSEASNRLIMATSQMSIVEYWLPAKRPL